MQVSPCLNPVSVYNKALDSYVSVPCGHCAACLCDKGFKRKLKVEECFLRYKYRYFITLTFSDNNLPSARYDFDTDSVISNVDVDYKGNPYTVCLFDYSDADRQFVFDRIEHFGFLPVLSRAYIRNFKKRLRQYLSYHYGKNGIFIFSCGEYGPSTYRPHYHVLCAFNFELSEDIFRECVNAAWSPKYANEHRDKEGRICRSLGIIDVQRCYDRGSENYCASYLSMHSHLPRIYQEYVFAPFSSQTLEHAEYCDRQSLPSLREFFFGLPCTFDYVSPKSSERLEIPIPKWYINRLFPKFPAYCRVPESCLFGIFSIFNEIPANSASEFACTLVDSFRIGCLSQNVSVKYLYWLYDFAHTDDETLYNKLRSFYYCIRRVNDNCRDFGVTLDFYIGQFVKFYSKRELQRLRYFYEYQESLLNDYYNPVRLSQLFLLYKSTDFRIKNLDFYLDQFGVRCVADTLEPAQQCAYSSLMHKICNDTIKTKKRNDEFEKRGLRRPVYVPRLSNNIHKFLKV